VAFFLYAPLVSRGEANMNAGAAIHSRLPREPWRRNQIAVTVATGLIFFGFTLVMPFMPYFVESLGLEGHEAEIWSGIVLFTAPFLAALMGPIWGRLTDRYGMKIMLQRIVVAMILHWVLMYFVYSLTHLMVLRVMLGVFSGFGTLSVALITHGVPQQYVGRVVGTLQAVQTLSAAAGPAVGGVLFDLVGFRLTFLITGGLCAAGFLLVTAAYKEIPAREGADGGDSRPLSFRAILGVPGIFTLLALLFFANMVARSFGLILPLFLKDLAGPAAALGLLSGAAFSLGAGADAGSALALGRLGGKGRPRVWVLTSLVLGAGALLGMAWVTRGPWSLVLLRLAYGLVAGGLLTVAYTLASERVGKRSRATTYGVLSGAAMLGGALGPLASGLLSPALGFRGVLASGAAVFLVLAAVLWAGSRRRPPVEAEGLKRPVMPVPR
jgi:MFS family permease